LILIRSGVSDTKGIETAAQIRKKRLVTD